jgi:predicted GNAT family N-acyltransferase
MKINPLSQKLKRAYLELEGEKFYYRHNKLYSMKKLRQLIVQAGFRVASSGYVNEGISLRENRIKIFLKIIFSPLLLIVPQFKDFIWVVAEK